MQTASESLRLTMRFTVAVMVAVAWLLPLAADGQTITPLDQERTIWAEALCTAESPPGCEIVSASDSAIGFGPFDSSVEVSTEPHGYGSARQDSSIWATSILLAHEAGAAYGAGESTFRVDFSIDEESSYSLDFSENAFSSNISRFVSNFALVNLDTSETVLQLERVVNGSPGCVTVPWCDPPPGGLCPCAGEFEGVLAAGNYRLTSEVSADLERAESIYLNLSLDPGVAVEIDVQPRFDHNWIMDKPEVPVPVAILGSASVDVLDVDVTTLAFGPDGAAPALDLTHPLLYWLALRDVNDDGETDLVATFLYGDTGLPLGEGEACLTGEIGGAPFEGCDTVVVFTLGCGLGIELTLLLPALMWLFRRRIRTA